MDPISVALGASLGVNIILAITVALLCIKKKQDKEDLRQILAILTDREGEEAVAERVEVAQEHPAWPLSEEELPDSLT